MALHALAQSPAYPTVFPVDRHAEPPPYIPDNTKAIHTKSYALVNGDTVVDEEGGDLFWEFDRHKNLIHWENNYLHFYENIKYDNLNRPVWKESMFGESNGNGVTTFKYPSPDVTLIHPAHMFASIAKKEKRFYDERGRIIRILSTDTTKAYPLDKPHEDDDTAAFVTRYEYLQDTDKLTKTQTFKLPEYTTSSEAEHLYDPHGRLVRSVKTYYENKSENRIGSQEITVYHYASSSTKNEGLQRIQHVRIGSIVSVYERSYTFGENYIRVREVSPTDSYSPFHFDKQWIFEEKKLLRCNAFDKNGKLVGYTLYEYTYWQ